MKKLILTLLLVLFGFSGGINATNNEPITNVLNSNTQQYATTPYIGWQLVGTPGWTTPSWYYCVTRSTYTDANGFYWFDVWFTSNSYIWDYQRGQKEWRYLQLNQCLVIFDNVKMNNGYRIDFSFREPYSPSVLRYKSRNPQPYFRVYWGKYYRL